MQAFILGPVRTILQLFVLNCTKTCVCIKKQKKKNKQREEEKSNNNKKITNCIVSSKKKKNFVTFYSCIKLSTFFIS
jgi:hypothetical protein